MNMPTQARPVMRGITPAKIAAQVRPSDLKCTLCHAACNALPEPAKTACHIACDKIVC